MRIGKWAKVIGVLGAMLLVVTWLGAGCGGGDDGGGEETTGPEDYAHAMCEALGKHADDIEKLGNTEMAFEDASEMQDFLAETAPVLQGLADDVEKIKPPADIKDWHDSLVAGLSDAAALFTKMDELLDKPMEEVLNEIEDLSAEMEDVGAPLGELADLPAEYQDAFANDPKCQEIEDKLGDLGW